MLKEAELVDQLCRSTVYQDFERAFCEVTQFPLRLTPPRNRSLPCNGQINGHQFSSVTDVPVRLGDTIVGLLQLGRPALEATRAGYFKDSASQFETLEKAWISIGYPTIISIPLFSLDPATRRWCVY